MKTEFVIFLTILFLLAIPSDATQTETQQLTKYESTIINCLLRNGANETQLNKIYKTYKDKGYPPAVCIDSLLEWYPNKGKGRSYGN